MRNSPSTARPHLVRTSSRQGSHQTCPKRTVMFGTLLYQIAFISVLHYSLNPVHSFVVTTATPRTMRMGNVIPLRVGLDSDESAHPPPQQLRQQVHHSSSLGGEEGTTTGPASNRYQSSPIRRRLFQMVLMGGTLALVDGGLLSSASSSSSAQAATTPVVPPSGGGTKCRDLESCREIGERKEQEILKEYPITRLDVQEGDGDGRRLGSVRYKRLQPGYGTATVQDGDTVDLIFSVSRANGAYMYSRGFGFEKVNNNQSDLGLDSYRVVLSDGGRSGRDLPIGIERAMIGMKKGERRRIEVPPSVGFETSDWKPEATTRRGRAQIADYKSILKGRGSSQLPFPAPTIWDVEVLSFRSGK